MHVRDGHALPTVRRGAIGRYDTGVRDTRDCNDESRRHDAQLVESDANRSAQNSSRYTAIPTVSRTPMNVPVTNELPAVPIPALRDAM